MSSSDLNASNPPALVKRLPTSTSSSGKASTARRNCSVIIARSTESRLEVRRIDASPMSTLGVPPMRSRVEKAKPLSERPSRTSVTSTQASVCLESSPTSKRAGPSAHMSAISASSASLSDVQSLVSISIAMRSKAPGGMHRTRACVPTGAGDQT